MRFLAFLIPILLGAAAATGFAPLEWLPLTLIAFAVWLKLVHDAPSLGRALLSGWLFGVGHFTVNNNWIQHAFDYQDKMPPELGYVAVVGLALYLAVYPMLAAGLAWRLASPRAAGDAAAKPGVAFVLVAAAAWIVTEWLRARMFTGYAWNPLGVVWLVWPDVAIGARYVGTYAMSGLLVVVAGALMLLVAVRRWRLAVSIGAILGGLVLAPHAQPDRRYAADHPRVRVVQPNVGQQVLRTRAHEEELFRRLIALSGRPGPVRRLVTWPEGALDPYLEEGYPRAWYHRGDPASTRALIARVLGPGDHALIGASALFFKDGELTGAGNSIFVLDHQARLGGRYDKAHLVPGGEYLPMRSLLEPLGLSRLVAGEIDFVDGPGPQTILVPGFGPVAMQICYEIIFSGEVIDRNNRPAMIFNPSNDAWFGSWGPVQHLAQARMRAIEEGLPVIRSTPNGISAVIDANGAIVAQIPRFKGAAIELPIPRALPPTTFALWGNWMAAASVVVLLALAMLLRRG
jgi:apolipoprotein N-acyltransferase